MAAIQILRFFEIYTAVTLHFTGGSYDYFKYDGEIKNVTETSFLKRKDKYFFERLHKKCVDEHTAMGLCVSNNMMGNKYIRNYNMDVYKNWLAYRDALSYRFKEELNKYLEAKEALIPWESSPLELLVNMVMSKELSSEFLIIFNLVMNGIIYEELDKTNSFVWEDLKMELNRYTPFLTLLWNLHPGKIMELKSIAREQK